MFTSHDVADPQVHVGFCQCADCREQVLSDLLKHRDGTKYYRSMPPGARILPPRPNMMKAFARAAVPFTERLGRGFKGATWILSAGQKNKGRIDAGIDVVRREIYAFGHGEDAGREKIALITDDHVGPLVYGIFAHRDCAYLKALHRADPDRIYANEGIIARKAVANFANVLRIVRGEREKTFGSDSFKELVRNMGIESRLGADAGILTTGINHPEDLERLARRHDLQRADQEFLRDMYLLSLNLFTKAMALQYANNTMQYPSARKDGTKLVVGISKTVFALNGATSDAGDYANVDTRRYTFYYPEEGRFVSGREAVEKKLMPAGIWLEELLPSSLGKQAHPLAITNKTGLIDIRAFVEREFERKLTCFIAKRTKTALQRSGPEPKKAPLAALDT